MGLRFPITGYDKGVEFVSDGNELLVISSDGSPALRLKNESEMKPFADTVLAKYAADDTHEIVLPFSGDKATLSFSRHGAVYIEFDVGGEKGNVYLYQVVSQTRHNADTHPYGDSPYQQVLDQLNLRKEPNLDLKTKADLDALLLRVGAWIDWFRNEPEMSVAP